MAEILSFTGVAETASAIDSGCRIYVYFSTRGGNMWFEQLTHPKELPRYFNNKEITEVTARDMEIERQRQFDARGYYVDTYNLLHGVCQNLMKKAMGR